MGRFPWQEARRHLDCGGMDVNRPRVVTNIVAIHIVTISINRRHRLSPAYPMHRRDRDGHKGREA
jgi:hypothetical protein